MKKLLFLIIFFTINTLSLQAQASSEATAFDRIITCLSFSTDFEYVRPRCQLLRQAQPSELGHEAGGNQLVFEFILDGAIHTIGSSEASAKEEYALKFFRGAQQLFFETNIDASQVKHYGDENSDRFNTYTVRLSDVPMVVFEYATRFDIVRMRS